MLIFNNYSSIFSSFPTFSLLYSDDTCKSAIEMNMIV